MLRKTGAIIMVTALCTGLCACGTGAGGDGGSDGSSGSAGGENVSWNIGYNTWGSGDATFDFMADVIEQALDSAGASYSRSSDDHMADKELQNIQNFISAGVDGIVMQTTADSIFPQAAEECMESEVPFVMSTFSGTDEDRAAVNGTNLYYLGTVTSDMYAEGYLMGKTAIEDGHKTALLLGGNVGDAHFEMRIEGFTQSFVTEGGGTILDEARCSNPGEGQEKANAMISASPDADCLFAMVGDYVPGAINAMSTLGVSMPVYCANANTDTISYIRDGSVVAATAGNDLVGTVAACLLINYLDGHQILDDDGKSPELTNAGFLVNADNIDDFEEIFKTKGEPFPAEVIQTLLWRYNNDVSYDDFVNFVDEKLQLDSIVEMWK